jgi:alanine-glyoxylate transaminase/serine-glyoxylate transaminase/serine-pyruvate transaminase
MEAIQRRRKRVQSWYLDVNLLASYWGQDRVYHHTAPISMNYALHEALRVVLQEGLEPRWQRHLSNHGALRSGLVNLGLKLAAQEGHQLWQLNSITIPEGIDEASVRSRLLQNFDIEIGAGLGPLKGRVWRVGLMGETSTRHNVERFLDALGSIIRR